MADARGAAELELRDYGAVLWRRKWILLLPALVVLAVAVGSALTQTALYRASAEVLVRQPPTAASIGATGGTLNSRQLENALRVAGSGEVRAVARGEVGGEPQLSVRSAGTSDVFIFTGVSSDPQLAARAANAYALAFVENQRAATIAEYQVSSQVLEQRLADITVELGAIEAERSAAEAAVPLDALDREEQLLAIAIQYDRTAGPLLSQRNRYVSELEALTISTELARTSGTVIIDPATPPSSRFEPNITSTALTALLVGLVLGVAMAFLVEYLDTSIRVEEDLAAAAGLPNLAVVPRLADWKPEDHPHVITREHPHSPSAESYRGLRTALQFLAIDRVMRTVQVTSPRPGDGKTTTATNLAVAMARAGKRVVLVDCDLRKPRIHEFFDLPNVQGFTTVLLGEVHLTDVAQRVPAENNLVVITSGPVPPNPSELLSGDRTRRLLDDLASQVDLVVLDSPPVLAVSDPLVLSSMADGIVLVASAGNTDRRQVSRAVDRLRQVDAPVLGTVLNQFSARKVRGYGYGYGYTYGGYGSYTPNGASSSPTNGAAAPMKEIEATTVDEDDGEERLSRREARRARKAAKVGS